MQAASPCRLTFAMMWWQQCWAQAANRFFATLIQLMEMFLSRNGRGRAQPGREHAELELETVSAIEFAGGTKPSGAFAAWMRSPLTVVGAVIEFATQPVDAEFTVEKPAEPGAHVEGSHPPSTLTPSRKVNVSE